MRSKCNYFIDVALWPLATRLDPSGWLTNFRPDEMGHAVQLLNAFIYLSEPVVDQLFVAAFQGVSRLVFPKNEPLRRVQATWQKFVDTVKITHVTGERPSNADSGLIFARKARDLIPVHEDQIFSPESALESLLKGDNRPLVFVDDFCGSGNQFYETWTREYESLSHLVNSFAEATVSVRGLRVFYCPLVCTERGSARITAECPGVNLAPAHFLAERYGALAADSLIWPDRFRSSASSFLETVSARAGIPDLNGDVGDWRGFRRLALAIAFNHSVPDATLPLFTWNRNGWRPLIRKP